MEIKVKKKEKPLHCLLKAECSFVQPCPITTQLPVIARINYKRDSLWYMRQGVRKGINDQFFLYPQDTSGTFQTDESARHKIRNDQQENLGCYRCITALDWESYTIKPCPPHCWRWASLPPGYLHQAVYKESPEDYQRLQPAVPQTALSAALRETSPQHPIPH